MRCDALASATGWTSASSRSWTRSAGCWQADEHAPTTVASPTQAVDVHLADSLAALELGGGARGAAGSPTSAPARAFPGLALAVALPDAEVSLVESQGRKCEFLERARRRRRASRTRASCAARAEEWREGIGRNDVVVARALAPQPVVLEYAAPLLRLGGLLVDWRGRRNERGGGGRAASGRASWACVCARSAASSRTRARATTTCTSIEKVAETPPDAFPAGAPGWPASGRSGLRRGDS